MLGRFKMTTRFIAPFYKATVTFVLLSAAVVCAAGTTAPLPGPGLFVFDPQSIAETESNYSDFISRFTKTGDPNSVLGKNGATAPWYIYLGGVCTLYYSAPSCQENQFCLRSGYSAASNVRGVDDSAKIAGSSSKVLELSHPCSYVQKNKKVNYPPQTTYDLASIFKNGWAGAKPWINNMVLFLGIDVAPKAVSHIEAGNMPSFNLFTSVLDDIPFASGLMFDLEGSDLQSVNGQKFFSQLSVAMGKDDYLAIYSDNAYKTTKIGGVTEIAWQFWGAFNRANGCGGGAVSADECQKGFWLQNLYDETPMYYHIANPDNAKDSSLYSFNASLLQFPYTLKPYSNLPLAYEAFPQVDKFYYQIALSPAGGASQSSIFLTNYGHTPVDAEGYRWGADTNPDHAKVQFKAIEADYVTSAELDKDNCPPGLLGKAAQCEFNIQSVGDLTPRQLQSAYLCVGLAGLTYYYGGVAAPEGKSTNNLEKKSVSSVQSGFGNAEICSVPNNYLKNLAKKNIYYFNEQQFLYPKKAQELYQDGYFMGPALYQLTQFNSVVDKCVATAGTASSSCTHIALPVQMPPWTWQMFINWAGEWYKGVPIYPTLEPN